MNHRRPQESGFKKLWAAFFFTKVLQLLQIWAQHPPELSWIISQQKLFGTLSQKMFTKIPRGRTTVRRRSHMKVPGQQNIGGGTQTYIPAQLRSVPLRLLNSYLARLDEAIPDTCPDCGSLPNNAAQIFNCTQNNHRHYASRTMTEDERIDTVFITGQNLPHHSNSKKNYQLEQQI